MLRPPSERPAGRRGVRGTVAALAAVGGVVPLLFLNADARTAWAEPVIVAAAVTLFCGAALLWSARRPVWIALAAVAIAAGIAGATVAIAAESRADSRATHEAERWAGASVAFTGARGALVTTAEAHAVPTGLTRAQLVERLGQPPAYGVQHITDEPDLRCLAYRRTDRRPIDRAPLSAFCFRDGRYVELGEW
jgi:hypothetical protein